MPGRDKGAGAVPRGPVLHLQDSITHRGVLKVGLGALRCKQDCLAEPRYRGFWNLPTQLIRLMKGPGSTATGQEQRVWCWYPALEAPQAS